MTPTPLAARLAVALLSLSALSISGTAAAEDRHLAVMFQNDVFAGSDGGGYTNGLAVAYLRSTAPGETELAPHWLLSPVAPLLAVGPAAMTSISLNQIMITPADISRKNPDPMDAPYLGALWVRAAQVSVQGDVADMFSLNLGMIGPASGARQAQTFIHRITSSTRPEGWDSQVSNRLLYGIERYRAVRFASGDPESMAPSFDAIVLGGAEASNMLSSVGGSVMLRYGTALKHSYASSVRQLARSGDPLIFGRGWMFYLAAHGDHLFSHAGISNDRPPGGNRAELREAQVIAQAGVAYGWGDSSLSFSLQNTNALTTGTSKRKSYGSLTYTLALR